MYAVETLSNAIEKSFVVIFLNEFSKFAYQFLRRHSQAPNRNEKRRYKIICMGKTIVKF
jgi:hypothetical protein